MEGETGRQEACLEAPARVAGHLWKKSRGSKQTDSSEDFLEGNSLPPRADSEQSAFARVGEGAAARPLRVGTEEESALRRLSSRNAASPCCVYIAASSSAKCSGGEKLRGGEAGRDQARASVPLFPSGSLQFRTHRKQRHCAANAGEENEKSSTEAEKNTQTIQNGKVTREMRQTADMPLPAGVPASDKERRKREVDVSLNLQMAEESSLGTWEKSSPEAAGQKSQE
ncbi:UNVERIFIED_CONTAM: hypothetical protein HHA_223650 [Hammondia hammondi]|eukprot:XP_008881750.1 hypothetical protein HHA_223650 [Hammondia hammondi]